MNITFKQLRLVMALADTGSISGAAKATHVTQPTASMTLKDVAETVGLPLYEVIGKTVFLTDVGKDLVDTARAVSHLWAAFEQRVDATQGLARGQLRVAVVSTAKYFMPRLIGSFCEAHPGVDLSLEVLNRDGVVQRLRDNLDDLYIMSKPPADMALADDEFMRNPIVVIAPSGDPITRRNAVPLPDLATRRFILREKGSGTRMTGDEFFRAAKFRPDVRLALGSNEAVKESVAGGLGIGVVSLHALHGHQAEHGVSVVDVQGFPLASAWHIVHPMGKRLSPVAAAFRQHLLHAVRAERGDVV